MTEWPCFKSLDDVSDLDDLIRVKSDGRLVEDEKFRVAEESLSESDTLFIPLERFLMSLSLTSVILRSFITRSISSFFLAKGIRLRPAQNERYSLTLISG